MKATFYVANEEVDQVKSLVRQYSSLRFLSNPLELWGKFEFRLEGNVQDFNEFFSESVFQKESGLTQRAPDRLAAWVSWVIWGVVTLLSVLWLIFGGR